MFRVDKTMRRFGLKPSQHKGLAQFPTWEQREWSAAQVVRRAAELAIHVGIKTHKEVIVWDWEDVYVLPYEDSVGKLEGDCRFV